MFASLSLGKAEVSEGAGAMAARHRGECGWWVGSAEAEPVPRGHALMLPPPRVFQEEYEDSSGNVVNKKTYEDLKRQGLL